jgi:hypothetical protein
VTADSRDNRPKRWKMKQAVRALCVAVVAALALFVGVSAASAGTVSWFGSGCFSSGAATTAPGPLTLKAGWATSSSGLTKKFLDVQYVRYSINGTVVTTPEGSLTDWGPITQVSTPNGPAYVTFYTTPVLADLQSGDSATVSFVVGVTKKVWDDAKTSYPAGLLFQEKTCTITAM